MLNETGCETFRWFRESDYDAILKDLPTEHACSVGNTRPPFPAFFLERVLPAWSPTFEVTSQFDSRGLSIFDRVSRTFGTLSNNHRAGRLVLLVMHSRQVDSD